MSLFLVAAAVAVAAVAEVAVGDERKAEGDTEDDTVYSAVDATSLARDCGRLLLRTKLTFPSMVSNSPMSLELDAATRSVRGERTRRCNVMQNQR